MKFDENRISQIQENFAYRRDNCIKSLKCIAIICLSIYPLQFREDLSKDFVFENLMWDMKIDNMQMQGVNAWTQSCFNSPRKNLNS